MIETTQGQRIPGLTILQKIEDPIRLCTIYARDDGDLVVGFGGTRPSWLDVLLNLDPSIEAQTLFDEIKHWQFIYQPAKISLFGHSQGGAHALKIAEWLNNASAEISVITYGGLPTADSPDCHVTNYLNRKDPMSLVPWWIFGIRYVGDVIKIGPNGWPSIKAHDPKTYLAELAKLE